MPVPFSLRERVGGKPKFEITSALKVATIVRVAGSFVQCGLRVWTYRSRADGRTFNPERSRYPALASLPHTSSP
jgi:hypothetical protein